MIGFALHLLGEQADARYHLENVLRQIPSAHRSHIVRFGYDQRALADNTLARILWLQGFPDQAVRVARSNIEYALLLNHELSLCNALGQCACRIGLWVGDLAAAHRYVATLLDHSARHALPLWHAVGRYYDGVLRIEQDDTIGGLHILRTELADLARTRFELRYVTFLADLAQAYARAGDIASAHGTIDQALERCHQNAEFWSVPELLRIKGEISRLDARPDIAEVGFLGQSLRLIFNRSLFVSNACGGVVLSAVARMDATARSPIVGTARGHEPRAIVAEPRSARRSARTGGFSLRTVHRRFRYRRPAGRPRAPERNIVTQLAADNDDVFRS
jgi:hypothetical protein